MMPMVTPAMDPWWDARWPSAKEDPFVLAFDNFLNSKEPPKHRGWKMVERWHWRKKKSRAVWKVLLMVGESSNVPVSWCWGVACLITWGNINTVQFGSVLNVRCLKKNRQGAGVPPKSTRCWHPRAWPKPVTTADSLNLFKHTLTHTRKCLGVCPCVYYNYIY
jgi:hypothetical protein